MLGLWNIGQFALGQVQGSVPQTEPIIYWLIPFSTPIRFKPNIRPSRQQFLAFGQPRPPPLAAQIDWFREFSTPIRFKIGLGARYQIASVLPLRLLPTPNVTAILAATEVNTDLALFAIDVNMENPIVVGPVRAQVSVHEVFIETGGAIAITED